LIREPGRIGVTALPTQNQTVEEILASIRAAITDDESRRTGISRIVAPPPAIRPVVARVNGLLGNASDADIEDDVAGANDEPDAQEVIDMAIEKAIDGVKAELGGAPPASDNQRRPAAEPGDRAAAGPRPAASRPSDTGGIPPRQSRPLLSSRSGAAVSASFGDLSRTMAQSTRALDEVVEDMLRPMLKAWLDNNLPAVVERLVREEIERVSRGR
jgi:cell pole-organizing protein PopZ